MIFLYTIEADQKASLLMNRSATVFVTVRFIKPYRNPVYKCSGLQ